METIAGQVATESLDKQACQVSTSLASESLDKSRKVSTTESLVKKRLLQKVSTISKRVKIIKWMIQDANENGEKGVVLRTINQFRSEFRGKYNVSTKMRLGYKEVQ